MTISVLLTDGSACVLDGAHGEAIDADATLTAYEEAVLNRLAGAFPTIDIEYRWDCFTRTGPAAISITG